MKNRRRLLHKPPAKNLVSKALSFFKSSEIVFIFFLKIGLNISENRLLDFFKSTFGSISLKLDVSENRLLIFIRDFVESSSRCTRCTRCGRHKRTKLVRGVCVKCVPILQVETLLLGRARKV